MISGYIIIPGPATIYIAVYGIHGTTPAPQQGSGIIAFDNVVCVHLPSTLTGVVLHHIFLKPLGRGFYTKVVSSGFQHIVAIFHGKIGAGIILDPVQGFRTLISLGRTDRHIPTHIDKGHIIPGIAVVELVQVNSQILRACSYSSPITIPRAAVDEITGRCGIDSKYQVCIACIPQTL